MPCNCIDRNTLKSYFQQCATPTEQNFIDLIDAFFHACEDDTICNNLTVEGTDGFNQGGETASLFLGDEHHSIHSVHGATGNGGVGISTYGVDDGIWLEQDTGRVGIGTTSPAKKLDVNGDARIQGELCADSLDINGNVSIQGTITATSLNVAGSGLVPNGTIVMFNGNSAPAGWAICDGTNGTPDLRGRFIVGYDAGDTDYDNIGDDSGTGRKQVQLTAQESGMRAHNHYISLSTNTTGSHVHTSRGTERWDEGSGSGSDLGPHYSSGDKYTLVEPAGDHSHTVQGDTNNSAAANAQSAHENRPPYYVLAFIMKL